MGWDGMGWHGPEPPAKLTGQPDREQTAHSEYESINLIVKLGDMGIL